MKLISKENVGVQKVYNTNVKNVHNYISEGGIINHNCVIDEEYQGEIHLNVVNTGARHVEIVPGMKLVQFILLPVSYLIPEELPFNKLYEKESDRGAAGFGSTDEFRGTA